MGTEVEGVSLCGYSIGIGVLCGGSVGEGFVWIGWIFTSSYTSLPLTKSKVVGWNKKTVYMEAFRAKIRIKTRGFQSLEVGRVMVMMDL
jgi:hypothetical protein